jgi:hypothetical protein
MGKGGPLKIFLKITHRRSIVCIDEIMQFRQKCRGPPMLQNQLVVIEMAHLMLGWRA